MSPSVRVSGIPGRTMLPLPLPRQARLRPDDVALVVDHDEVSYRDLSAEADDMARRLATAGVGRGDRVAVCLPNGRALVALLHGVARIEAVLVPLNTRLTAPELKMQVADAAPRIVVWDPALGDRCPALGPGTPSVAVGPARPVEGGPAVQVLSDLAPAEIALAEAVDAELPYTIVYTSGTSGPPRGAVLTHGNHVWSALASAVRLGMLPGDRWLAPLPLFHVGGLAVVLRAALYGATAVVHTRFDAAAVAEALRDERISVISLVPTMLLRLLEAWGDAPAPPSLRAVLLGGGPSDPSLLAHAGRLGFPIAATYGLTETASQVATCAPAVPASGEPVLPAMPPLPCTEVCVVDDNGTEVGPGQSGEILVRGPTVMPGYWSSPDVTGLALAGGWLHTRDVGFLDHLGRLTVVGRRCDLIVTGGENVYPAEIEAVLDQHPAVAESCVVGMPDAEWGAVVAAVLVAVGPLGDADARPGFEAIEAHVRAHLGGYKVPRRWVWHDGPLPRTAAGKVMRAAVREALVPQTEAGPGGSCA